MRENKRTKSLYVQSERNDLYLIKNKVNNDEDAVRNKRFC